MCWNSIALTAHFIVGQSKLYLLVQAQPATAVAPLAGGAAEDPSHFGSQFVQAHRGHSNSLGAMGEAAGGELSEEPFGTVSSGKGNTSGAGTRPTFVPKRGLVPNQRKRALEVRGKGQVGCVSSNHLLTDANLHDVVVSSLGNQRWRLFLHRDPG